MVNRPATPAPEALADTAADRRARGRDRAGVVHEGVLGPAKINPFGDLHTLQHLSARLARGLRHVFEPLVAQEVRSWAEPLVVQRFADYRAERPDRLTAWLPLAMMPGDTQAPRDTQALCVLDGRFVMELLDRFFGGAGTTPHDLPVEFTPAAEAMIGRLGSMIATPLSSAWEPLARIEFQPCLGEANAATVSDIDADDAMIVTRFGIAWGTAKPVFVDLLYPVSAMKPHGASLTGKVVGRTAEPDPAWRTALTRAAMGIRFPIRSVLAEPVVPLSMLMHLKIGDVIPISFGADVPVMVGGDRLGIGTVGTSNGQAAIRLTQIAHPEGLNP